MVISNPKKQLSDRDFCAFWSAMNEAMGPTRNANLLSQKFPITDPWDEEVHVSLFIYMKTHKSQPFMDR